MEDEDLTIKPATRLKLFMFLAVILLPACNSVVPATMAPATHNTATTSSEVTAAVPTSTEPGTWKTYHSEQAGYRVEYPADWTVSEQVGTDGSIVTSFSPIDGGTGIMVIVQSGELAGAGNSDIPNTRCEQIIVSDISGMRCFDTINFATATTVAANGQTFTIATLGKRIDESIYNRFLLGFQFIK